jgi:hypothetical protein
MKFLGKWKLLSEKDVIETKNMPTEDQLLLVHTKEYLKSLNSSWTVRTHCFCDPLQAIVLC